MPEWEHRYQVSDEGGVRSLGKLCRVRHGRVAFRLGKVLKPIAKDNRYLVVVLADGDRKQQRAVHDLVLTAFVGPRPEGLQARHLDGNKAHNQLSNLCWGTAQENSDDRIAHGTQSRGESHPGAKINESAVRYIRRSSEHVKVLAERFGISKDHIYQVRTYRCWKHI